MRVYLLIMILAGAITFCLVPAVRALAFKVGAVPEVRARDVHTTPIARMGGVAMYLGIAGACILASHISFLSRIFEGGSSMWGILLGAGLMCLLGAIDDVIELVWYAKLAGEMIAAGVMAWQGVQLVSLPLMGVTVGSNTLTIAMTVIVVVMVANAVNFVDGLDGLAAGIVAIASLAFFLYSYYLTRMASPADYSSIATTGSAVLVGACLGFLPHNFHKAKIFMGDSGALMLGTMIAGCAIVVTGQIDPATTEKSLAFPTVMPLLIPVAVLLVPLVDFIWAVIRRLLRGQSPFHADKGHLHHRLLRLGHSHVGAVLVLYMWAFIAAFSCVLVVIAQPRTAAITTVIGVALGVILTRKEVLHGVRLRAREASATREEQALRFHAGAAGGSDAEARRRGEARGDAGAREQEALDSEASPALAAKLRERLAADSRSGLERQPDADY